MFNVPDTFLKLYIYAPAPEAEPKPEYESEPEYKLELKPKHE